MRLFYTFPQVLTIYYLIFVSYTVAIYPEDDAAMIKETMSLIQFGEENIELVDELRDVFLVVGNTGVGKSTLTKFITGNNSQLLSVWSPERGGYLIEDLEGDISINSTLISHTLLPKLMVLPKGDQNLAFYDLPGFSDTRNVSVEIANAFFMKKVADHARRVKIVFVADYADLRAGGNRKNLKDMLVQGTDYVRDMAKFKPAVSLIATKVDNDRVNDTTIIQGIAAFLEAAIRELPEILDDEAKLEQCTILLTELTTKGQPGAGSEFSRIGIFRAPDQEGPISEIPTVMRSKPLINTILFEDTEYVGKVKVDFGVSLSPFALSNVTFMATNVFQNVTNLSNNFGALSAAYYNQLSATQAGMTSLPPLYALLDLLHRDYNILAPVTAALSTAETPQDFMDRFREGLTGTGPALDLTLLNSMDGVNVTVHSILRLGGFLNFFQEIIGDLEGVTVTSWSDPFVTSLQALGPDLIIALASDRINRDILTALKSYGSALLDNFRMKYDGGFYREAVKLLLESDFHKISGFLEQLGTPEGLRAFSVQDWASLAALSVSTPEMFKLLPDWPAPGLLVDLDDLLNNIPAYDLNQWIQVGFATPFAYIQEQHDHLPERGRTEIHSPPITDWGIWGPWADCPVGTYVSGMTLKTDTNAKVDEGASALNGVTFFCSRNYDSTTMGNVTSTEGTAGIWGREFHCPGALKAVGFQMRVEAPRGTGDSCHLGVCVPIELDDTAGNNVRLICEDGTVLEGDGGERGEWVAERRCVHDQFLCGIQSQVADGGAGGDEDATGLNNLNARCCNLPLH